MIVQVVCTECGKAYSTQACWAKRARNPTCSRKCCGKARGRELVKHSHLGRAGWKATSLASFRQKMTGPSNHAWRGGVTIFKTHGNYSGVRYVRCPTEFIQMARQDGYVMEHRLIMARLIRRCLTRIEVVHHRDHDPTNNTVSNLEIWPDNRSHKLAEHGRLVECAAVPLSQAA